MMTSKITLVEKLTFTLLSVLKHLHQVPPCFEGSDVSKIHFESLHCYVIEKGKY